MTKFGQHFLVDQGVLRDMVKVVQRFGSRDTILEIGPGQGVLTKQLVKLARRVVAVEIDCTMSPFLDPLVQQHPNLEIIYADILKLPLVDIGLVSGQYSLASNLPYDISGAVLRQFLSRSPYPSHMALLLQKEVAQRITAKPGNLSILGLSVQAFSDPHIIRTVGKEAFRPKPKVESAIVSLNHIRKRLPFAPDQEQKFFWLVKVGFAQKRKLLSSNFKNVHIPAVAVQQAFTDLELPPTARAQELSVKQWCSLVDKLDKFIV